MKVLYVTYHYLHGNGGGIYCSRGYINAFAALSEGLSLLFPVKNGEAPEGIDPAARLIPVSYDKPQVLKFVDLLLGKVHRFFGIFDEVLASGDYDTVVFDSCYASFRLLDKARRAGCRVIVIHHNYQCEYVRDNYRFPVRGPFLFWTRQAEKAAVRGADLNITLTEEDEKTLRMQYDSGGQASFRVVGVFESHPFRENVLPPAVEAPVYVITGNLSMLQTEASLIPWLDDLLPVLRTEVPSAQVIVAGKKPTDALQAKCREKAVELVDTPPDMQAVLLRGRYYLCPTSRGGGLKLRIMDGLKNGLPVLTHAVSARGYEAFLNRFVFSYSDKTGFREALLRMNALSFDRQAIIQAYRDVFSFESGCKRLASALL